MKALMTSARAFCAWKLTGSAFTMVSLEPRLPIDGCGRCESGRVPPPPPIPDAAVSSGRSSARAPGAAWQGNAMGEGCRQWQLH